MGVAGGALLFQGIERLLGYGGSPFASAGWTQPALEQMDDAKSIYRGLIIDLA
jgi:hypothetical protein